MIIPAIEQRSKDHLRAIWLTLYRIDQTYSARGVFQPVNDK